jgi:transposase
MFDTNEVAQRFRGRAEVRSGIVRRRRWTDEEKGRIVAEAVAPGAVAAVVARRHELTPQHLSNWIRDAKAGRIALPAESVPSFVPVVATDTANGVAAAIELAIGSVVVRIPVGADERTLEGVVRALRRALA